jgi:hypothetical protein
VSADRVQCETPRCLTKDAACSVLISLRLGTRTAFGTPSP